MTGEHQAYANTDRELWRERPDDYYSPSIHVTEHGGIGINVGGQVIVMSLQHWHALARISRSPAAPSTMTGEWKLVPAEPTEAMIRAADLILRLTAERDAARAERDRAWNEALDAALSKMRVGWAALDAIRSLKREVGDQARGPCDCGATEKGGPWANVHSQGCASLKERKVR